LKGFWLGIFSYVVYPENPHLREINKAGEILKKDGVVIYPTDTVYGLGAALSSQKGIKKIYQIKKISTNKLLSFICPDLKNIAKYAHINNHVYKIMKRCVPGPFTFILPATKIVPKLLFQKRRTVGIRIPDSPLCREIVHLLGEPIISTSVPNGADGFFTDPDEIIDNMENDVDLVLDAGVIISEPSTIVDLSLDTPEIIRKGSGDTSLIY
jgi:tRNA threonylcarbamoyl adenosine modification protein (Sua5/YciO/YrdC/YwlC family)